MPRILLAATLLLGLAAAPAFAQSSSEDLATRTMQQNQRAFIPVPARPQAAPQPAVKFPPSVATLPQVTGRRFAQAEAPRR